VNRVDSDIGLVPEKITVSDKNQVSSKGSESGRGFVSLNITELDHLRVDDMRFVTCNPLVVLHLLVLEKYRLAVNVWESVNREEGRITLDKVSTRLRVIVRLRDNDREYDNGLVFVKYVLGDIFQESL
jgi:hypothetical protein